jgi:hypothetical protein
MKYIYFPYHTYHKIQNTCKKCDKENNEFSLENVKLFSVDGTYHLNPLKSVNEKEDLYPLHFYSIFASSKVLEI